MKHFSTIGAAFVLASGLAGTAVWAQQGEAAPAGRAASAAAAPAPAASKAARRARRRAAVPIGDPGVAGSTGGTPDASSRTPGGPPPGMKSGITFPLPSIGGDAKK